MKPSVIDEDLWETRGILHRAMQVHISDSMEDAKAATKAAYQRLSTLLDETQSNHKPSAPCRVRCGAACVKP